MTATFRSGRVVGSKGPSWDSSTSASLDVHMVRAQSSVARGAGFTVPEVATTRRAHMLPVARTHCDASAHVRATDGAPTLRTAVALRPHAFKASLVAFIADGTALTLGVEVYRPSCGDCVLVPHRTKSTAPLRFATELHHRSRAPTRAKRRVHGRRCVNEARVQ